MPIAAIDFAYAHELRCTIRQISRAQLVPMRPSTRPAGLQVQATVGPMLVPQASPFAWSRGTENMVLVSGKYGGDTVFSGHGAGGHPTAVAVVSDLLAIAHGSKAPSIASRKATVSGDLLLRHYIRFIVKDRQASSPRSPVAWRGRESTLARCCSGRLSRGPPAFCGHGRAVRDFSSEAGAG